jgi:hypothetical protein
LYKAHFSIVCQYPRDPSKLRGTKIAAQIFCLTE